ncbi:MAG TPA: M43 family zinc metalloprotease, partial [Chitinophagaceae bacterium]|nr:M43 family zinc metalloprotease [Chitinophagaceae bacterium]
MKPAVDKRIMGLLLVTMTIFHSYAQEARPDRCGSMDLLLQKFKLHPALKIQFDAREKELKRAVSERLQRATTGTEKAETFLTVPVVFHIVLPNPAVVTDAQIQAQMDTLNKDYAGINADTSVIPSWFKGLFGKANIQFALAQQTSDGESTTGIDRVTSSHGTFDYTSSDVKHNSTGGVNAWNTNNYLNVWITQITSGYLGISTFPADGDSANQGIMIDYRSLPGGSYTNYNFGKTLTHEIGHYFNLYHIWGDDGGSCSGTDYVNDTPNQGNFTSGGPTGVVTDACTTTSPGILY